MSRPEKVAQVMAHATTPALCDALETLHASDDGTAEVTRVRKWMLDELEQRVPEVDAALGRLCDTDEGVSIDEYVRVAVAVAREFA